MLRVTDSSIDLVFLMIGPSHAYDFDYRAWYRRIGRKRCKYDY